MAGGEPVPTFASEANAGTGSEEEGKAGLQGGKVSMGTGGTWWVWGGKGSLGSSTAQPGPSAKSTVDTLSES